MLDESLQILGDRNFGEWQRKMLSLCENQLKDYDLYVLYMTHFCEIYIVLM